ncbi:MAG: CDP-alcohol phosphatidyltransferase family protein [Bacteroidetes bacterium]|nr:MAG: CDP-alcohol phosphatidyltransferase family protein [Bacteroidota bacterium]TAF94100.1 MAG: CDP-alcohol phosphatidyltransferase family protein [Bacteroidota bacterium]
MINRVPQLLIYFRLSAGLALIVLSFLDITYYKIIAIILFSLGLVTDIFDGIIARHLNISSQFLRRLDSTVDQVFFVSVAIASYIQCKEFFIDNKIHLSILVGVEALTYVISYSKFKKEVATHSIGAKIWTISLFITMLAIISTCQSTTWFSICFWLGIITRIEIIAILFTLKHWTNDEPTLYHAILLRQGKTIKRHKLFNG